MLVVYVIFMWVNAWLADRAFRDKRLVWGCLCAVMSAFCFIMWARGVA